MTPDPLESTTADLIDLIYDLQGNLRMLAEMLAQSRNNPVTPHSWNCLAVSQHYLNRDLRKHLH